MATSMLQDTITTANWRYRMTSSRQRWGALAARACGSLADRNVLSLCRIEQAASLNAAHDSGRVDSNLTRVRPSVLGGQRNALGTPLAPIRTCRPGGLPAGAVRCARIRKWRACGWARPIWKPPTALHVGELQLYMSVSWGTRHLALRSVQRRLEDLS
jgi:hypothetical protein